MTPATTTPADNRPPEVFRPRRLRPLPLLLVGVPLAGFATVVLRELTPRQDGWWLGLLAAVFAGLAFYGTGVYTTTRVTLSERGLTKTPRWASGLAVPWAAVQTWRVGRPPDWHDAPDTARVVWLRLTGWRWEVPVFDVEVERPGFTAFVARLRAEVGGREQSPDGGG